MFLTDLNENNTTNDVLQVVYVILIVIAVLAVAFLLFSVIAWYILKHEEKKVYSEFEKVAGPATELKDALQAGIGLVEQQKLKHRTDFFDEFKAAIKDFDVSSPKAIKPVKDQLDVGALYVGKVLSSYGRGKQSKEAVSRLNKARAESDKAFLEYSKVAGSYNAILNMWPTRLANRLHRKQNRRTKIDLF